MLIPALNDKLFLMDERKAAPKTIRINFIETQSFNDLSWNIDPNSLENAVSFQTIQATIHSDQVHCQNVD